MKYVIRSKDLANTPFLLNLVEAGLCGFVA